MPELLHTKPYTVMDLRNNRQRVQYLPHCPCCKLVTSINVGYAMYDFYFHKGRLGRGELLCFSGNEEHSFTRMDADITSLLNIPPSKMEFKHMVDSLQSKGEFASFLKLLS